MLASRSGSVLMASRRPLVQALWGLLAIACLGLAGFVVVTDGRPRWAPRRASAGTATAATGKEFMAADLQQPLVFEQELRNIKRPIAPPLPTARTDHGRLARQALSTAVLLRPVITFRIIVIAWKRRASLDRLVKSLLAAEYHGFRVHLDFHMDGGGHPRVVEYIEELRWPHGRVRVNRHAERVGLERTIMESWQPVVDSEFALFFEDDIAVSPRYFEYVIAALSKYVMPNGLGAQPSVWLDRLIGISLNTPRYNEIAIPGRDWIPQAEIGDAESQFLFQLPCSWGALYFPWHWRSFVAFYRWRRERADEEELHTSVPDSATSIWRRSWKKYLVEWMYMRGLTMLYPSLPNQLSFSTHHREPGEHTDSRPEEHLVDELGILVLNYFTVPLVASPGDDAHFERILAEARPLRELPVVSFHHERVPNVYSLAQLGAGTTALMERHGWAHAKYRANPSCILDEVTFPVLDKGDGDAERYLLFEGQLSLGHQLNALQNAVAYAKILNRTLIVPPLVAPTNASLTISVSQIIRFDTDGAGFVPMIPMEEFVSRHNGWIDRITQIVPWSARKSKTMRTMDDRMLTGTGLVPASVAILHVHSGREADIRRHYGGCHDRVLAFRHLFGAFDNFTSPAEQNAYHVWVRDRFAYGGPVQAVKDALAKELAAPVACAVYSRGENGGEDCGRDIMRTHEKTDAMKLTLFRSCHATADRTVEYAIEDATKLQIALNSMYVMVEASAPAFAAPKQAGRTLTLFTLNDILRRVEATPSLADLPAEFKMEIALTLEGDLCGGAAFFLGNKYSAASNRIAARRSADGLPTNVLGGSV